MQLVTGVFFLNFAMFASAHSVFLAHNTYFHLPWLDSVMHLWGGIIIAGGVFVLTAISILPSCWTRPLPLLLVVVLIAVAWEIFGYYILHSYDRPDYVVDTVTDIILGGVGGSIGLLGFRWLRMLQ